MFKLRAGATQLDADAQIQRQKRIVESARVGWPPPMSGGHFCTREGCYTAERWRLPRQWMVGQGGGFTLLTHQLTRSDVGWNPPQAIVLSPRGATLGNANGLVSVGETTQRKKSVMWLGLNATLQYGKVVAADGAAGDWGAGDWGAGEASNAPFDPSDAVTFAADWGPILKNFQAVPRLEPAVWPVTFEQCLVAMEMDGRIYSEGDGAFVLCGHESPAAENQVTYWMGRQPALRHVIRTEGWREGGETGDPPPVVWRIEGNLVDGRGGLDHATVNGVAPLAQWHRLLELLTNSTDAASAASAGSSAARWALQFHQYGVYALPCGQLLPWNELDGDG